MWLVRFTTLVLLVLPFLLVDGGPLIVTLLFFPAVACAMGVAHQASDHEDEDDLDFISPVFRNALTECTWVLVLLTIFLSRGSGWEAGFLKALAVLIPSAVFALAGCHIGVLFTKETMSRQAEAFGAAAFTTAYLVVAATGLYLLIHGDYTDMIWPVPLCIMLIAGAARTLARVLVGPVKIGSILPLIVLAAVMVGWTILAYPLVQEAVQRT